MLASAWSRDHAMSVGAFCLATDHREPGLLDGACDFTGLFTIEYELSLAFHQLEYGVSGSGGGTHAIVARVLGHRR